MCLALLEAATSYSNPGKATFNNPEKLADLAVLEVVAPQVRSDVAEGSKLRDLKRAPNEHETPRSPRKQTSIVGNNARPKKMNF